MCSNVSPVLFHFSSHICSAGRIVHSHVIFAQELAFLLYTPLYIITFNSCLFIKLQELCATNYPHHQSTTVHMLVCCWMHLAQLGQLYPHIWAVLCWGVYIHSPNHIHFNIAYLGCIKPQIWAKYCVFATQHLLNGIMYTSRIISNSLLCVPSIGCL